MEGASRAYWLAWMSVSLFAIATGSSTETGEAGGEALAGYVELGLDGQDGLRINYLIS